MDENQRRDRIVSYLRIKPLNHGQIYTFQIAIPPSENIDISSEKRESIKESLTQQGTNLIPLVVRRTQAYSEEEEYELVYGANWCLVAKELDVEKLWVWVFDLTDEEAATVKLEMQQLLGIEESQPSQVVVETKQKEPELIQPISQEPNELVKQVATLTQMMKESQQSSERNTAKIIQEFNKLSQQVIALSQEVDQIQKSENQEKLSNAVIEQITATVKQVIQGTIPLILKNLSDSSEINTIKSVNRETNPKPPATKKDYNEMTVTQLKSEVKKRNLKVRSQPKKQDLITALENSDNKNTQ
jgi:hypothetical protein